MRVQWIDSLKGFLIVLVVLGHVVQSMIDSNVFYTSNYVLVPLFLLDIFLSYAVVLFGIRICI